MNPSARGDVVHHELFEIRRMLARSGTFDGYRAAPVAVSGVLATAGGLLQRALAPDAGGFVALWAATAAACFAVNVAGIVRTYGASPRRWERSLAFAALLDLLPAMIGGALLTVALSWRGQAGLLPGVWMILYGGGVISSRRHVPRACTFVGLGYVAAGAATLLLLEGDAALENDVMAGVFGTGQLLLAWILARPGPRAGEEVA